MKTIDPTTSSFKKLIEYDNVYVDKTGYVFDLICGGCTYYFCSRPRRFGKSLMISTIETVFEGRRDLFEGLEISRRDYDWKIHPVFRFDFSSGECSSSKAFSKWLNYKICEFASDYGLKLAKRDGIKTNTEKLIRKASQTARCVILVDEYDKPLSDNVYTGEAEGMRGVIKEFFEAVKAMAEYLRFVFITGVTRYAKVSIFSSMNNLFDISMDENYSSMFGYTQKELEKNFKEYISKGCAATELETDEYLLLLKMKYDGYRFSTGDETVYNPVSIGMFFAKGGKFFESFWADTGGNAKLVVDMARRANFNIVDDLRHPVTKSLVSSHDIVEMTGSEVSSDLVKSLLYQSGYLTIRESLPGGQAFLLDFPNAEVREAFSSNLIGAYIGDRAAACFSPYLILPLFERGDVLSAMNAIRAIYSSVPCEIAAGLKEHSYHMAFYCMMKSIGADIDAEVSSSKGRADAVLKAGNHMYVIEFKTDKSADEALAQIRNKEYHAQYEAWKAECNVHLLGIAFSTKDRNISDWKEYTVR